MWCDFRKSPIADQWNNAYHPSLVQIWCSKVEILYSVEMKNALPAIWYDGWIRFCWISEQSDGTGGT